MTDQTPDLEPAEDILAQLEFAARTLAMTAWEILRSQLPPAMKTVLSPPWDDLPAADKARLIEKTRADIRESVAAEQAGETK